jgi:hypothetical protein
VIGPPPVAAVTAFNLTSQGAAMPEQTDPHVAWWAELQRIYRDDLDYCYPQRKSCSIGSPSWII